LKRSKFVYLRVEPLTTGGEIASGHLKKLEQRSFNKNGSLRGHTLTEIHKWLQEVCCDSKLYHSFISHLSQRFCQGQSSVKNKECTGRLRTSTGNTTARRKTDI
jgi:hypothetical protein